MGADADTIEELRPRSSSLARYNETWLVARHGYRTPTQVRAETRGPALDIPALLNPLTTAYA